MELADLRLALLASASFLASVTTCLAADAAADASGDTVQSVIVTAPRIEVVARRVQQDAPNLINVQSAETIEKYPDFNAAEALGRIAGVSISTDTGEGRFVNIRGIDGNLAGATFGGVPLLNTNPGGTYFGGGGRAVEFDTIPTGSVDGIIVTKTTLPDHEAEGLGGTVELTPRTATHITKPFLEGAIGYGYEPAHEHGGPFNLDIAGGMRFGFDNGKAVVEGVDATSPRAGWISNPTPFSIVLTASRRDDFRGFDDIEEDYTDPSAGHGYDDLQLRRYNYHRRRFGYGGEFDFQPNENHNYYLRANIAGYRESVIKNRLTYDFSGYTPPTASGSGFTTQADLSIKGTNEEETHRNSVYIVGGKDVFDKVVLDYRASYSRATFAVGHNYGTTFSGPTVNVFYDNSGNEGDKPVVRVLDGTNINNPALYKLKSNKVSNSQEQDLDEDYAYAVNLQVPVRLLNGDDQFKFGGQIRERTKSASSASQTYKGSSLLLSAVSDPAVTNFYEGLYSNGPQIQQGAITTYAAGAKASGSGAKTLSFNATENIYAGYGQYSARVGQWGLLAGVRVEKTEARYGAYSDDNASQNPLFVVRPVNYTDVFPTVQVRYDLNPNVVIRATYSTGVGRPGFNQNTAATTSNHDTTDPQISQGNPNLKPTTGDNFDLSFELYLPRGGILQFGLFDKEFDNYIVTKFQRRLYTGADPEFAGLITGYTTFGNVQGAYARGAEAAYHQQFLWLPKPFDGFGVESNVTIVDSHIQEYDALTSATGHAESGRLPGTSQLTWNLAGFYEAHGVQARLAAEYVSKELFGLGGSKAADTIQDDRLTMDFTASYRFGQHYTAYFNAKNLTDEPLRFYIGGPSLPIQREIYDVTYEAGIRAKF